MDLIERVDHGTVDSNGRVEIAPAHESCDDLVTAGCRYHEDDIEKEIERSSPKRPCQR